MSHGTDTEPDLTAMLDMVMNLLMFFIICASVIKAEKNDDVKLPESTQAHLIATVDQNSYFLNLVPYHYEDIARRTIGEDREAKLATIRKLFSAEDEGKPCILLPNEPYPLRTVDLELWLDKKATDLKRDSADGKIHAVLVLRRQGSRLRAGVSPAESVQIERVPRVETARDH